MITPALLQAAMGCTQERALLFARPLAEACERFSIDTPARLAAFLAQIGHESGGLRYVTELASGEAYEGRKDLGNTHQGDGVRFRGHGLIQITGRANHAEMRPLLILAGYDEVPDFEAHPERLTDPRWAAASAAAYWHKRNLSALADAGRPEDFERITRRINGGLNGQADRLQRWERAKAALAPAVKESLPPQPQKEPTMAPILAALLPSLVQGVPKLARLFGSGSEVSERNIKAVEMAMEVVKEATAAPNAQAAVEAIQADPAVAQKAAAAIESRWLELTEAGGDGIAGARKANAEFSQKDGPRFWLNPAFWISMILLGFVAMLLVDVFYVHPENYIGEIKTQIVTGLLLIIGMVGGYWIGTSFSSARKDERAS